MAAPLRQELQNANRDVRLYPALKDFLASIAGSAAAIDEISIGAAILESVLPHAREIAREGEKFELGKPHTPKISGYATPKPSLVAVSFEISFELDHVEVSGETESRSDAELSVKGVCSYNPILKQASDIEIREWSKRLKSGRSGFFGKTSPDRATLDQYSPSRMRIIVADR